MGFNVSDIAVKPASLFPWKRAVAYIPLTVLAVPASILTVGGGYLFGLPIGFIADSIGSTVGATTAFLVGKTIGRSYVVSKLKDYPQFRAVAIAIQRSGFKIVLLLRLVPLLPFNMLNYLLSVTPVNIWEYMLASWIGMMILLTIGLVASVVLMILVTKVARKSLDKALLENDSKVDCILVSQDLPIVNDPHLDLEQQLIIKIDPNVDNHDN